MKETIWILELAVGYHHYELVACFKHKPTAQQLIDADVPEHCVQALLEDGSASNYGYNLSAVELL